MFLLLAAWPKPLRSVPDMVTDEPVTAVTLPFAKAKSRPQTILVRLRRLGQRIHPADGSHHRGIPLRLVLPYRETHLGQIRPRLPTCTCLSSRVG